MSTIRNLIREQIHNLSVRGPVPGRKKLDWLWVVLLGVPVLAELVFDPGPWLAFQALGAILIVAVLPWRRRFPLPVILTTSTAFLAIDVAAAANNINFEHLAATAMPLTMLAYALFRWSTLEQVLIGATAAFISMVAGSLALGDGLLDPWAGTAFWVTLAALAMAMRYRASLIQEQQNQVRLAERHDLARELHDTVAHHVSAIAVQAQAAQFISGTNPEAARVAMRNVEELANLTIEEMRHMVGILRSADGDARRVAPTSLADLVDNTATPTVTIWGDLDLGSVPSPVAAAVYRIAQESVTNARRHNRGITFIDVTSTNQGDSIALEIINDGSPTTRNSGSGYGLIGMQERVSALEGTFESGPRPTNGWRTAVTIPLRGGA